MSYFWLLFTFTWLGSARLQYINTNGPGVNLLDSLEENHHSLTLPLPYVSYFNVPSTHNYDLENEDAIIDTFNKFSLKDLYQTSDVHRQRRTIDNIERKDRWHPNLVDTDNTMYYRNDEKASISPFIIQGYVGNTEENATEVNLNDHSVEKKSFSPWGGKRNNPFIEQSWTWKRSANMKEPSMPKRVRFSPWGGKRSGQVIYKPGTKGSKIIFSSSVPELTKIVSNYSPTGERLNVAGFQMLPLMDKRHPIRILALSTKIDDKNLKEALPFKDFIQMLPKFFKVGHPYVDVNIKRDGKRKVKFSAWGGKRSPPIIGPIWTQAIPTMKDSPLSSIVFKEVPEFKSDDHTFKSHE